MVHDLDSFRGYFNGLLADTGLGIHTVIVGGINDILGLEGKVIRYPLLFVELPDEEIQRNGTSIFSTIIFMLTDDARKTTEQYKTELNAMRGKLITVLDRMVADTPTHFVFVKDKIKVQYKEKMTGDLLYGAYAEIQLTGLRQCP